MINYWIPDGFSGDLTLEILDAEGNVLNEYASGGAGMDSEEAQEMRAPFRRTSGTPTLSVEPGMNRFVWNLMETDATGRSVMALPGQYAARLTAGDASMSHSFSVVMDPRVAADGVTMADLQAQYDLVKEINATMAEAAEVASRIDNGVESAGDEAQDEFEALQAEMRDDPVGSYPQPMLLNQLRYLSSMLNRADQRPGQDAYVRHEQLKTRLAEIKAELERLERLITEN
jgi:hypothetical protein